MSAFDNVAARLKEHLPFKKDSVPPQPITAWAEQAKALNRMASDIGDLKKRVAALELGTPPPPDNGEEPPPTTKTYAPQTYNIGSGNQDPRYCIMGLPVNSSGESVDTDGILYDSNGLNKDGRRNRNKIVAGLKPADMMDGRDACDGYEWQGHTFPGGKEGWPAESYKL